MMHTLLYWSRVCNEVCNGVSFDLILYLFVCFFLQLWIFNVAHEKTGSVSESSHFHNILRHQRLLAQPKFTEINTSSERKYFLDKRIPEHRFYFISLPALTFAHPKVSS